VTLAGCGRRGGSWGQGPGGRAGHVPHPVTLPAVCCASLLRRASSPEPGCQAPPGPAAGPSPTLSLRGTLSKAVGSLHTHTHTHTLSQVGTLSKAVGSLGGFVCCSEEMRDYLVNTGRALIYSTALPVHKRSLIRSCLCHAWDPQYACRPDARAHTLTQIHTHAHARAHTHTHCLVSCRRRL
jgi:hypothetical protein